MDDAPDPLADDEPAAKPDRRDWRGRVRPGRQVAGGFGVAHLLLWVTCCAVYFAAIAHLEEENPGVLGLLIVMLLALGTGAGLAGMLIFCSRWLRGVRWQVEPGEWLLPAFGARFALELAHELWLQEYVMNREAVAAAVTCCLLLLPLFAAATPRRWKAFYFVLVALYAAPLLAGCVSVVIDALRPTAQPQDTTLLDTVGSAVSAATPFVAGGIMLVLVVWDYCAKCRHGWLHWLGLGTYAWYLVAGKLVA